MGYLVCDKCGGYYELQSGETPEDFTTECECGGKLAYSENLDDGGELSNEHMNTIHCIHCGTENPDYANFCQECGKKISDIFEEKQHDETKIVDTESENYDDIKPGYVIFLSRANGHMVGSEFPNYFNYNYGINTDELLVDAMNNNHLTLSKPLYNVEKARVIDIKKILRNYGQPVSGRKKELVNRVKNNLTEEEIISEFPGSYYVLTDKGEKIVKENDHVAYYHYNSTNFSGLFSLEEYHDLLKNNTDANLKYTIAIDLLGKYGSTERRKGNWGLYRNSILSKAKVNKDKNDYKTALNCYFKVCILDTSGLSNNDQYSKKFIGFAPGVIDIIQYLIKKTDSQLESNSDALKIRYYKCFDDLNLPKSILSKEQSFDGLIKEIGIENNIVSDEKTPPKQTKESRDDQINFVTFNVEKIDSGGRGKAKYLFEGSDLFIEEVAIKFYENLGYNALWSENFYWGFLMALLFWDVIFTRINGVFNEGFPLASQFNDMPHDFFKPEFYLRRKNLINNRLNQLKNSNLEQEISNSYKRNYGKSCRPIERWDHFTLEELLIPTRMDKTDFLSILERLISNFSENRSGLPDLIIYNNNELFFSEVKSERDRVSDKQMSWHLFLAKKMGIKVDLFLVNYTERKINNLKSKYSLYEEFKPEGSLENFKNDLALIQNFAADSTNMINNTKFTVDKDGNDDKKIKSKIQEIQNEINQRKQELDKKLKVLSSEIIIVRVLKDKTNPYNFEFEISIDEKKLNKFVEYYKRNYT